MYNHAPDQYLCPFCLLIQGIENEHVLSVRSDIVYKDVWHYHLHVTPRYRDDDLYTTRRELMAVDERAMHAEKIRRGLAGSLEVAER